MNVLIKRFRNEGVSVVFGYFQRPDNWVGDDILEHLLEFFWAGPIHGDAVRGLIKIFAFFQYALGKIYLIIAGVLLCDCVKSCFVVVGVLRDNHQFGPGIAVWDVARDIEVSHIVSSLSERRSRPSSLDLY